MYIIIEDPENPGRRLYADLLITTAHSGSNASINVSILSVDVNDVATESSLAAAIANDLKDTEILEYIPDEILRERISKYTETEGVE